MLYRGMYTDIFQEVVIPQSKTKCGVNETCGISGESFLMRQKNCHFSEGYHNKVDDESDVGISYKEAEGTTSYERCTRTDNKTCSNCAT